MAHDEEHLKSSDFISDIVIGMSDGLTVPFALAAGISSAVQSNGLVVTACIAEIVAGSIAMGLGGYLAGKTELDHYKTELKREYQETIDYPEIEKREVKEIFEVMGLSQQSQNMAVEELVKDTDKWVKFMMKYELNLEEPDKNKARKSAFNIGMAYVVGGAIPMLAYVFTSTPQTGFKFSFIITVICLLVFGYFKSKLTGQKPIMGALKMMAIGVIAAMSAYFLVKLFN